VTRRDVLFVLRYRLSGGTLTITAADGYHVGPMGHARIDGRAVWNGRELFAYGDTYCAVSSGTTLDGRAARELVSSLIAMRPGDTDAEYFAGYTAAQLAWASAYGEELSCLAADRYGAP
jgi:hypothetical protein